MLGPYNQICGRIKIARVERGLGRKTGFSLSWPAGREFGRCSTSTGVHCAVQRRGFGA